MLWILVLIALAALAWWYWPVIKSAFTNEEAAIHAVASPAI